MADTFFKYDSVTIEFDGEVAVDSVSFLVNPGEILGVVGESGSGKSTIIKSINGILNSDACIKSGQIIYNDKNLLTLNNREMRRIRGKEIGMIFQDSIGALCPIRTIGNQIVEAIRAHERINKKQAKERAFLLLEKFNFTDVNKLWKSYPFELSGGMNQRVGIAMAMLLNPPLLLADEPTSALDEEATKAVLSELKRMSVENGTSIIMVTHDMQAVREICDHVLVLKNGNVVEQGSVSQVLNNPESDYTKALLDAVPVSRSDEWKISLA